MKASVFEERRGVVGGSALAALPASHPLAVALVAEPIGGRVGQVSALQLQKFDALDQDTTEDRLQRPVGIRSSSHLPSRCSHVTAAPTPQQSGEGKA